MRFVILCIGTLIAMSLAGLPLDSREYLENVVNTHGLALVAMYSIILDVIK